MNTVPVAPAGPPAPFALAARPPALPQTSREHDQLPAIDVYLRYIRQEVARVLHAPPDARASLEDHVRSLFVSLLPRTSRTLLSILALAPGPRAFALPLP